ncbi:hypothetical protein ACIF83_10240 [Streptomyces sp. NPDC085866]|uniref:hypothetical protein n=1 Tax=Streptomyces sp. NPDC085866 TaxID=3365736 RepID=UPI0037D1070C
MGGFTDQITECELCGKPELRGTVQMIELDADGNDDQDHYFGTTCAAKASGWTQKKVKEEAKRVAGAKAAAEEKRLFTLWKLENFQTDDTQAVVDMTGLRYTELKSLFRRDLHSCL